MSVKKQSKTSNYLEGISLSEPTLVLKTWRIWFSTQNYNKYDDVAKTFSRGPFFSEIVH